MIDDRTTAPDLLTYIAGNVEWLAHRPEAVQAFDELLTACRTTRQAIDTTPALIFLGTCDECGEPLHAEPHHAEVLCRPCGRRYLTSDRHEAMLDKANDHLETATHIATYMSDHGETITPDRIWQWRKRGRITAKGRDREGHRLYRIGDVRDVWTNGDIKTRKH